jgi:hypothetical protein
MRHQMQDLGDFGLELVGFSNGSHGKDSEEKCGE